jgi:hypothetical protein
VASASIGVEGGDREGLRRCREAPNRFFDEHMNPQEEDQRLEYALRMSEVKSGKLDHPGTLHVTFET